MALVTLHDIEQYSGFKYSDFTENGLEMTIAQWTEFINSLIPKVTQVIHRFCNVYSFEPATFTELHNGKGATNYDSSVTGYNDEDMVFFLHQLYADTLLVYEDTAVSKNAVPAWTLRTVRSALAAGDYGIYQENDVTRIIFHTNIPAAGYGNVKFTYNTGYPLTSAQLNDIRFQCLRAIQNVLLTKKKIQEASSIRNFGVRDYSQMFDAFSEGIVLDDKVKSGLEQYRRAVIPATFCYE